MPLRHFLGFFLRLLKLRESLVAARRGRLGGGAGGGALFVESEDDAGQFEIFERRPLIRAPQILGAGLVADNARFQRRH